MVSLQALIQDLEVYLDVRRFADVCPNGLQIGRRGDEVRSIAVAVTASLEVIRQAVASGVEVLFVHHGLFWKGDPYPLCGAKLEKIRLLLEANIALVSYHLPLDAHVDIGNNWRAARDLGWTDLAPFGLMQGNYIGVKGRFSPMPRSALCEQLERYYGRAAQRAEGGREEVSSAGLISGGAYRQLGEAAAEFLDCFITGSGDEPVWHWAAEEGINFYALGHAATEKVGPRTLGHYLAQRFGVAQAFIDQPNPF